MKVSGCFALFYDDTSAGQGTSLNPNLSQPFSNTPQIKITGRGITPFNEYLYFDKSNYIGV
jgi:hypothetical protein